MLPKSKLDYSVIVNFVILGILLVAIGAIAFMNQPIASANNAFPSITKTSETMTTVQNLAPAPSTKTMAATVYRDPKCGCCEVWMKHLRSNGFQVSEIQQPNMDAVKQKHNVPDHLTSCHTAIINGTVIEGHVPADDIKRFLSEPLKAVGLAVPGMPIGSPGMEDGKTQEAFTVFSFDRQGNAEVFNHYSS